MPKRCITFWTRFRRRRQATIFLFSSLFLVYVFLSWSSGGIVPVLFLRNWRSSKLYFNWTTYCPDEASASPFPLPPCVESNYSSYTFALTEHVAENVTFDFQRRKPAGQWRPPDCRANSTVVLIVPFRHRHKHLKDFLPYMHAFLQERLLDYAVVIVQQPDGGTFNKARIMNAAFLEVKKLRPFDCYIFHDVDLLPLDRRMNYGCSDNGPMHMAAAIDKFRYR